MTFFSLLAQGANKLSRRLPDYIWMAEAECQAKRGRCRPGDSVNSKNKGLEEEEETEKIRLLAAFSLHRAPARTESPSLNAKLGSLVWCLGR
jgi:hypothetical protein